MRHTVVHRGRRTVAWSSTVGPAGLTGFPVPAFPELTDIEAAVTAGGYDAASFAAPAADLPEELSKTVGAFVSDACGVLSELWRKRRAAPGLLPQSPKWWKQAGELIKPVPVFRGFPNLAQSPGPVTSLDMGTEAERRLEAAGLTARDVCRAQAGPRSLELGRAWSTAIKRRRRLSDTPARQAGHDRGDGPRHVRCPGPREQVLGGLPRHPE